jgi:hypothetical protein
MLPLPACTGSEKVSTMLVDAAWFVAPCDGRYVATVGGKVSATENWYVVPLSPPNGLLFESLITPGGIVTAYCMPEVLSELVGLIVTTEPEYSTCLASSAEMLIALPAAGVSTMLPTPACTASLNVSTMFVVAA